MATSLKPIRGRQIRELHHIETKISELQTQYQHLL